MLQGENARVRNEVRQSKRVDMTTRQIAEEAADKILSFQSIGMSAKVVCVETVSVIQTAIETALPKWIPVSERLPTKSDGDHLGWVQAWNKTGGCGVSYFENVRTNSSITHWQTLPDAPK
jgi:hypothetical protein